MRKSNYNKFPSTKVEGTMFIGWENIRRIFDGDRVVAVDFYTGVLEEQVIEELKKIGVDLLINTRELLKAEEEIRQMTQRFMTEDVLFGYVSNVSLAEYFDVAKLEEAKKQIAQTKGKILVIGTGAATLVNDEATLVYVDMARWEIQQRMRKKSVQALGVNNNQEAVSLQYKRGYFNDWRLCDKYKTGLFERVDYWLDTHQTTPKMIDKATFFKGMEETVQAPFRVVPFFDPAPWGGQWMKEVCDLDRTAENYGWCFDCVPEENSLLLNVAGELFELPSMDLVLLKSRELLGEPVEARFGTDFPIRFDFLDTMGGGNLSLQVHPTNKFIYENFGMFYTQDESYYLLDAGEDAVVYLGVKKGVDKKEMIQALKSAQEDGTIFDAEKYVNQIPAKKHDHFLIPGGTIHCSGSESMVLEISSTPNLFTFKLWDWQRLGLDGKPRPINIERGSKVIDWSRDTDYVNKYLNNKVEVVATGEGWIEEKTGLHENEFIETRRHWFKSTVSHQTNGSVNVLNLISGNEVIVESPTQAFEPFIVHYAETFIIPASVKEYTITPYGSTEGETYATIKAFVRF